MPVWKRHYKEKHGVVEGQRRPNQASAKRMSSLQPLRMERGGDGGGRKGKRKSFLSSKEKKGDAGGAQHVYSVTPQVAVACLLGEEAQAHLFLLLLSLLSSIRHHFAVEVLDCFSCSIAVVELLQDLWAGVGKRGAEKRKKMHVRLCCCSRN